jgi:hypothetical protein
MAGLYATLVPDVSTSGRYKILLSYLSQRAASFAAFQISWLPYQPPLCFVPSSIASRRTFLSQAPDELIWRKTFPALKRSTYFASELVAAMQTRYDCRPVPALSQELNPRLSDLQHSASNNCATACFSLRVHCFGNRLSLVLKILSREATKNSASTAVSS